MTPDNEQQPSINSNVPAEAYDLDGSIVNPMPWHQYHDMICALVAKGIDTSKYQVLEVPDSDEHAFGYWGDPDDQGSNMRVKDDVIAFLQQYVY